MGFLTVVLIITTFGRVETRSTYPDMKSCYVAHDLAVFGPEPKVSKEDRAWHVPKTDREKAAVIAGQDDDCKGHDWRPGWCVYVEVSGSNVREGTEPVVTFGRSPNDTPPKLDDIRSAKCQSTP